MASNKQKEAIERVEHLAQAVQHLEPLARARELEKLGKKEKDPEVKRLLAHMVKYTVREQSDADFLVFLEKRRKRSKKKTQYTPEEISALRAEFDK